MVRVNEKIDKVCGFYVSDWHLITMLLPHIDKSINEKTKTITILQEDAKEKVEILLSKLNLNNEEKISEINWNKTDLTDKKVEIILNNNQNKKVEILICGDSEYINNANEIVKEFIEKNKIEETIKIIDCYNMETDVNIKEVLNQHNTVINTAGEMSKEKYIAQM